MVNQSGLQLPPLSLYVHVPWCVRKCPYCDFNSHRQPDIIPEQLYLNSLLEDLRQELTAVQGRHLHSIFIGGGTPSLMSGEFYHQLLAEIEELIGFEKDIEITLEANPGTFEQDRFQAYLNAGVNRLSIGVQSFDNNCLQKLGRIHRAEEAIEAASKARQLGFQRINLDLMHGLPGQTADQAMDDLQRAIALEPGHISWYQLTIEPNTEFHSRPPTLPEDETLWQIQEQGQSLLAEAGYLQYEISAYSQGSQQSRHNLNYWRFGDYIGVGAGAHGKNTCLDSGTIERRWKLRQPKAYMDSTQQLIAGSGYLSGKERIEEDALPLEFMMNALRLFDGVETELFSRRTGLAVEAIASRLNEAKQRQLLDADPDRIAPNAKGRLFLNDLLELFM